MLISQIFKHIYCCRLQHPSILTLAGTTRNLVKNLGVGASNIKSSLLVYNVRAMSAHNMDTGEQAPVNKFPLKKPHKDQEPLLRLNNIEKSQQDTREYRGLQLENAMKVLLISDPNTDVSAAALCVQVGHMSDPDYLPGLAHFCEHMLFLGTEKYPHENGYTNYLSQSGGGSNAATYPLMTRYHFHVAPDKLDDALDRFAQFFIAPLFTASATDREMNAVNSEHEKNLSSDSWRLRQVHRHLAKPDHPFSKFGSGNLSTLKDIPKAQNIDVREELLKFHKKWYSANIMTLAVIGKESLDDLENMVIEKFSEIENKDVKVPTWDREPFDESRYREKVMIVPIKDIRSLAMSFTTDDLNAYYKSSPDSYITHLMGHESKGSILSKLRELGWCNVLMAGHNSIANGFGFFEIVLDLTNEGLDHVDDIVKIVFEYLNMLRAEGPKKWIFDECVKINELSFRFKDKETPENLVIGVVTAMQLFPLEEVLTAPYLNNEWRPDLIQNLLEDLVPSKCRIFMVSQTLEDQATDIEPWYKTKIGTVKIDPKTFKIWENCTFNDALSLPGPNDFIPENLDLKPLDADLSKHPAIIMDSPILRVWHKQDDYYLMPKACMVFDISNPVAYLDPLNANLNQLMVAILKDQLVEYLYDANLAGLKLLIAAKSQGMEFLIRGYSDKQVVLLEKLMGHLFDFKVDKQRFEIIKDEYRRILSNFKADQPYQHSIYYLALLLTEIAWTNREMLDAMELVTCERLVNYGREFFQRMHMECFIYGNVTKQQSLDIAGIVNKRLETTNAMILPLLARQMLKKREYKLNPGDSYVFEKENDYHKSSCTQLYFQCGQQTDRTNIMVHLLAQVLSEPCYDCLRTKEQLGYIVMSGPRKVNGAIGVRFIVQSSKHPSFVEDRIESFIDNFTKSIEELPDDEFARHKEALTQKKLETSKTVLQQFGKFYSEISVAQYHFERDEVEVALLQKITKQELIDYYKNYIAREGPERRVLAVHIVSTLERALAEELTDMSRHEKIDDLIAFKSSKELYPIALPFLDIRPKGARSKL